VSRFAKYRRALRALRTECPPPPGRRIRVRLDHSRRWLFEFGGCRVSDAGVANIYLRTWYGGRRVTPEELRDSVIHEWAHATSWTENEEDHGPSFGIHWAAAYRAAIED
jgi:hypothetical protein